MILKSFLLFFVLFALGIEGSENGYRYNDKINGWFKYHPTPTDWNDAVTQCELRGAVLASPLSNELRDAIIDIILQTGEGWDSYVPDMIYTGLFTNFSDGSLHSIDGSNVSNLPVVLEKQDCVAWVTNKNQSLRRVQCTEKLPYVCYKNDPNLRCGDDYSYSQVSKSCYKFHSQGLTWHEANTKCKGEGARLAVANSVDEIMTLRNIYDKHPNSDIVGDTERNVVFVGVRGLFDGKLWMTVDGEPLAKTSFEWASTEPNNVRGDEYCGTFGRQGKLYDDSCQLILPYICEKEPLEEIIYGPVPTNSTFDSDKAAGGNILFISKATNPLFDIDNVTADTLPSLVPTNSIFDSEPFADNTLPGPVPTNSIFDSHAAAADGILYSPVPTNSKFDSHAAAADGILYSPTNSKFNSEAVTADDTLPSPVPTNSKFDSHAAAADGILYSPVPTNSKFDSDAAAAGGSLYSPVPTNSKFGSKAVTADDTLPSPVPTKSKFDSDAAAAGGSLYSPVPTNSKFGSKVVTADDTLPNPVPTNSKFDSDAAAAGGSLYSPVPTNSKFGSKSVTADDTLPSPVPTNSKFDSDAAAANGSLETQLF